MAVVIDYLDQVEIGLCHRVNRIGRHEGIRRFFERVSKLGDWPYWAAMGGVLASIEGSNAPRLILHFLVTAAIAVGVYKLLKRTLVRERPFIANGNILCGAAPLDKYSFPSGHTLHAVMFSILLSAVDPLFVLLCVPFAVLVAVSRIILGLHYPSDVLVGAALGALLATSSLALL